jgi:hypothetical protein
VPANKHTSQNTPKERRVGTAAATSSFYERLKMILELGILVERSVVEVIDRVQGRE